MKNPHRASEGRAQHSDVADKGSLAHLTCTRCNTTVTPLVLPSGPHLRADCPNCGRYLCFVPKRAPWTLLQEPTLAPKLLKGVE